MSKHALQKNIKLFEEVNYSFGAIMITIQFLYNKHGQVGRHMKDLDQIICISKGFLIWDILSWANLRITVLGR